MLENMASFVTSEHMAAATFDPPVGPTGDDRLLSPDYRPLPTKDGYITVGPNTNAQAFAFFDAIGRPELKTDPRFDSASSRTTNAAAYFDVRAVGLAQRTTAEWLEAFEALEVPAARYNSIDDLFADPHLADMSASSSGRSTRAKGAIRRTKVANIFYGGMREDQLPAPRLGEHTRAVLEGIGYNTAQIDGMIASGAAREKAALAPARDAIRNRQDLQRSGGDTPMIDVTILATGLGFPEGPVVCADGSLVLTEIRNQRCSRVARDGKVSLFSNCGGGPNGLAIGPDGYFYLCNNGGSRYVEGHSMGLGPHPDYKFGSVARIDPKTGEAKLLYNEVDGHLLSAPNDIVFDTEGGFYFTDLGKRYPRHRDNGGVYYAFPDGSKIVEVAYPMLVPTAAGCRQTARRSMSPTRRVRVYGPSRCKGRARSNPRKSFSRTAGGWLRASAAARVSIASRSWPAAISPLRP